MPVTLYLPQSFFETVYSPDLAPTWVRVVDVLDVITDSAACDSGDAVQKNTVRKASSTELAPPGRVQSDQYTPTIYT